MIKIACWNIRGIKFLLRQQDLKDFIREKNIGLIGLVETKVK